MALIKAFSCGRHSFRWQYYEEFKAMGRPEFQQQGPAGRL